VVKEEEAVLIALVRRHRRAVGAVVRRAVNDEAPGAVEEETGPAAVRPFALVVSKGWKPAVAPPFQRNAVNPSNYARFVVFARAID